MKKILIVDDEVNIQNSIKESLPANEFTCLTCTNPLDTAKLINKNKPDLVLLDIWMPEKDGNEVLTEIKTRSPELPVIIISGHANISTTMKIAKSGANDFLEKPFSSEALLQKIKKELHLQSNSNNMADIYQIPAGLLQETREKQKTITKNGVLKGKGLHTGTSTGIIISPLPPDSGIIFEDIASGARIKAGINHIQASAHATSLNISGHRISCVEHLLAVFHIFGINNISVKVNQEIPICDGSAVQFVKLIKDCGITKQNKNKKKIIIDKQYEFTDKKDPSKNIIIEPGESLAVKYYFEMPDKRYRQNFNITFNEHKIAQFEKEVAPARTFGFLHELKDLQANGLGQGGDMHNFLFLDGDKVLNNKFNFDNELARHKTLDIIGDFMLMGAELQGKITAYKTGHFHNINLIKKITS
ncbi:MAG TPA: UDP-3-O-acyl-N-acetylglucosamine deacetylase [Spirochaetota bacterium]|nr:UDP-3-O-acyl-N-acetylglucosamine deacetylase [Spirochaetota bacterium]